MNELFTVQIEWRQNLLEIVDLEFGILTFNDLLWLAIGSLYSLRIQS